MKIQNIGLVNALMEDFINLKRTHQSYKSLTTAKGGAHGMNSTARLSLGGDIYGNGEIHRSVINILDHADIVRICRKLESDAWGKVVIARSKLRELGVEIDCEGE
jgi:hypothetical protein